MQKSTTLEVEVLTWPRDSYGLFDYESSKVYKTVVDVSCSCTLRRKENDVSVQMTESLDNNEGKQLLQISRMDNGYYVVLPGQEDSQAEKLWLAVRGLGGGKGYHLSRGDVIRLGRLKFRVQEAKGSLNSEPILGFKLADILNGKSDAESEDELGTVFKLPCRICLSEVFVPENPLISPCKCTGTMKYIHLNCLQLCLKSKINMRSSEFAISFSWKGICCDLCKKQYPLSLNVSGKVVQLIEIPKPPEKYIILESLCKEKGPNKTLHILSFHDKNSVRIGRGHDCELRVSDISVSRTHARLYMQGNSFYIDDHHSKFGTLIQIKRPVVLNQYDNFWLQSGSSLSKISVNKPWSFFCSCFSYEVSPYDYQCNNFNLYPINSGICLSKYYKSLIEYKYDSVSPINYNQIGFNSSYEEETFDCALIEEVEIAENSSDNEVAEISGERLTSFNYLM